MNCSQARTVLFPSPEKALVTIETPGAVDHLRECGACRTFFEQQREWSRSLRATVGGEPAPDALRERMERLAEKHKAAKLPSRRTRRQLLAAAAVIAVASGTLWLATRLPS